MSSFDVPESECSIKEAAEHICGSPPPLWLINALRNSVRSIPKWRVVDEKGWSRSQMRKRLESLCIAAKEIEDATQDPTVLSLMLQANPEPMHHMPDVWKGIVDIMGRAKTAAENIRPGGGQDKVASLHDGLSAQEACASVVFEAWWFIRGKPPGVNQPQAHAAAECLWRATGGAAPPKAETNDRWRNHLIVARDKNGEWRYFVRLWLGHWSRTRRPE